MLCVRCLNGSLSFGLVSSPKPNLSSCPSQVTAHGRLCFCPASIQLAPYVMMGFPLSLLHCAASPPSFYLHLVSIMSAPAVFFFLHLAPPLSASVQPPFLHEPASLGSAQLCYLSLVFCGLLSPFLSVTYQSLARRYVFGNNDTSVPQVADLLLQ